MAHRIPERDRLPHALYRAEQVRALDRVAIEVHGIPGRTLMERAGRAIYRLIRERWPHARRPVVLAGIGNNGGDGYVVARLALEDGLSVRVLQLGDLDRLRDDAAATHADYCSAGGLVEPFRGEPLEADLVVDALLGTGLERPVEGLWAEAIEAVNAQRAPVVAVDIPSGLHSDTGLIMGVAVRATATLSFIGLKQGLFVGDGPDHRGDCRFDALEIPASVYAHERLSMRRIDWLQQGAMLPPRPRTAHKGDCGHVLIVGGAPGMSGAARLAGEAALRSGAGLVTIATHPEHARWLNLTRPELMVAAVETADDLTPLIERAHVVAVGPGLGRSDWGLGLWHGISGTRLPLVVDADALNALASDPMTRGDWILTPHPGEAARLLGTTGAEIQSDRLAAVRTIQRRYGGTAVLKGAGTLIQGDSQRPPAVCSDGNPGMATAGSGDVLTGVLAALVGQGLDTETAAAAGVSLHAAAGDKAAAAGERGLVAGDIVAALRGVANRVEVS
ncbi:NAD(P)H-hydrate dehydratase [Imhoffiella purpurea]|uniref:Bifunctional NAD(P)H-hydrate repair enzyme n=1 Tax=Imhoffiella purpurea TaxID=1249627 RepID=W9VHJ3_9GAMM|nr:NAD(P)H-hydrate dehydratase [Imhoffiella purpurea]EXJ16471.1 NAD(P)HX epimerase / NAD(P)HX dehydratase [Imhoffiella purpurea]